MEASEQEVEVVAGTNNSRVSIAPKSYCDNSSLSAFERMVPFESTAKTCIYRVWYAKNVEGSVKFASPLMTGT